MNLNHSLLTRTAVAIHERLNTEPPVVVDVELPMATWQQCETLLRRMCQARQRGFQSAAARCLRELRGALRRLDSEIVATEKRLAPRPDELCVVTMGDIHADLAALYQEFDEVSLDRRRRTISVTTEPIQLEGVYLGPFEICLDWRELGGGGPHNYRVIARDAQPAATNDSVTHPHVEGEAVCEGEGGEPIRRALEQGRVFDFFVIVATLLRTYNSAGPFVSLSDWNSVECADCGTGVGDDERSVCERCDATVCDDCNNRCSGCDDPFCNECVTPCSACAERHCGVCMKQCFRCQIEMCINCLDDNERCSDCHDQESEESEEAPVDVG